LILEVCVASLDDAIAAERGGADRLELNSALSLGGLTPSLGLLQAVRETVSIPIIAMIRPRAGGFHYRPGEYTSMLRDIEWALRSGADGIAFGILQEDGRIDLARCRRVIEQIEGHPIVFHRAFDVVPDQASALEQLIDLGVTRVLTSGGEPTALEGADRIAQLRRQAGGRIEVLPASGIRPDNVGSLLSATGCDQVHASLGTLGRDPSTLGNPRIAFSGDALPEDGYRATDLQAVRAMRKVLDEIGG